MMLSPQAARMGTVHTTLRKIGLQGSRRAYGGGVFLSTSSSSFLGLSPWKSVTNNNSIKSGLSKNQLFARFKSSRAAAATANYEDSDDEEGYNNNNNNIFDGARYQSYAGHAAAMEERATVATTDEPWMINLGRNNDNEWLMRPRNPEEWFTGVAPTHQCPGTFTLLFSEGGSVHVGRWVFPLLSLLACLSV